jgi:hypothetical protein
MKGKVNGFKLVSNGYLDCHVKTIGSSFDS